MFCFSSHSGKNMSNYILGVSCIFQALSSSSTHTAGTIRQSVSAWLENMIWKSWELMTTSMSAANPGGQMSCCLMLWWTAEGYHSSWLANTGPVSCLWYWQMHTRNPSMQKKENETVTVNERVWEIDFISFAPNLSAFLKSTHTESLSLLCFWCFYSNYSHFA